jgi:hypothetical protein
MEEDPITAELRALEERLLQPDFRQDRLAVSALLADDFLEYGSSGRIFDKQQILDLLQKEAPRPTALIHFRARRLNPTLCLVTYQSAQPDDPSEPGTSCLRSSLWALRQGRWQIVFHQGTRIPQQAIEVRSSSPPRSE